METPSDSSAVEEVLVSVEETVEAVEEPVIEPKKTTPKKKAQRKGKKPTAKKQRPRKAAEPVAPLPTAEELAAELKENIAETKDQFVQATVEPAKKVFDTWTIFAGIAKELAVGTWSGFLGNKKRKD